MSSVKWRPFCLGLNVLSYKKNKKKNSGLFQCLAITCEQTYTSQFYIQVACLFNITCVCILGLLAYNEEKMNHVIPRSSSCIVHVFRSVCFDLFQWHPVHGPVVPGWVNSVPLIRSRYGIYLPGRVQWSQSEHTPHTEANIPHREGVCSHPHPIRVKNYKELTIQHLKQVWRENRYVMILSF